MKKFAVIYIIAAVLSLLLFGCAKPGDDDLSKIHKMLSGIEAYTATAEIMVRSNKAVENYVVKQYFKYPDRYRLEVVSPDDKKGKVTLYDGEKIWINHPQINQSYIMENFKEVEESSMFPGYFAKNLLTSEEAEYKIKSEGGNEFITIKVEVPGGNSYRKHQLLYFDRKKAVPVKMEVMDSQGNVTVTIHYRDFIYNGSIDEKLFRNVS